MFCLCVIGLFLQMMYLCSQMLMDGLLNKLIIKKQDAGQLNPKDRTKHGQQVQLHMQWLCLIQNEASNITDTQLPFLRRCFGVAV